MPSSADRSDAGFVALTTRLAGAGFVAADEEAEELLASAAGDAERLDALVARRLAGEPLAWITGRTTFCGLDIRVDPGVYVPRWQSEPLARLAAQSLPPEGTAIDLCTGTGAVAKAIMKARPAARVVASDVDEGAGRCALANGVEAHCGDLFDPLPRSLERSTDVIVAVVPYVPTAALEFLPGDTLTFESSLSYDGGQNGAALLRRVIVESPKYLRVGGTLLLELGGDQVEIVRPELVDVGYREMRVLRDDDGDVRGIAAVLGASPST
jgi:release factor glutamine methyltransferase